MKKILEVSMDPALYAALTSLGGSDAKPAATKTKGGSKSKAAKKETAEPAADEAPDLMPEAKKLATAIVKGEGGEAVLKEVLAEVGVAAVRSCPPEKLEDLIAALKAA